MTSARGAVVALVLTLLIGTVDVVLLVQRTATPEGVATPRPSASPPRVETVEEQLVRVAGVVERIRGLRFPAIPDATYLTSDELSARVRDIAAAYTAEQAAIDELVLKTLGALPPDYDIRAGVEQLLSDQVAGFYDPETGEMVVGVRERGRRLTPLEEVFLAHELEHALADAVLGLPGGPDDVEELGEDRALAESALVEGDASLTMQEYVTVGFSALDQVRFAGESLGTLDQLDALDRVPWVLRRSLEFPYLEGLAFVTRLREVGGWAAVDAAYDRPPTTTAQILFPERYLARRDAVAVPSPGSPGSGWEPAARQGFGAADLLFLLEAPGGDRARAVERPRETVAAWAGGELTAWRAGLPGRDGAVVVIVLVDLGDDGALCGAVSDWYLQAFPDVDPVQRRPSEVIAADGPSSDGIVACEGRTVRVAIAPDVATARAAAG